MDHGIAGINAFRSEYLKREVTKDVIKSLSQAERKTLEAVLVAIENHATRLEVNPQTYAEMQDKIRHPNRYVKDESKNPVWKLISSIVKGILNTLHLRMSSDKVFSDFQRVRNKEFPRMGGQAPQQEGIPDEPDMQNVGGGEGAGADKDAASRKLGAGFQILQAAHGYALRINHVYKGTAMAKAGFEGGDILIKGSLPTLRVTSYFDNLDEFANEKTITNGILLLTLQGDVTFTVHRRGEEIDITLPQITE